MLRSASGQSTGGQPADADVHDPIVGTVLLSKLRVLRRIGAGGAGVVYEVEHLITKHRRALKTLKATSRESPVQISRFLREAGIAGRLKSERIVETFDAGRLADGTPYVLMELLDGRSLGAVLREDGPIDPARLVKFGIEICDALEAAHAAGVVHRDIKPENVFLVQEPNGDEHVKVLDFGICKALDPSFDEIATLTGEGATVGTPYFMAPEQIEGSDAVDARTDVYALGVTLYQLASGELPFQAASAAALAVKIERGTHRALDAISRRVSTRFSRAVERAMARQPADRFQTIAAFRDELRAIDAASAATAITSTPSTPPPKPATGDESVLAETSTALVREAGKSRLRRRSLFVALGAATLAGAVATVVLLDPAAMRSPRGATSAPIAPAAESADDGERRGAATNAIISAPAPSAELEAARAARSSQPTDAVPAPDASTTSVASSLVAAATTKKSLGTGAATTAPSARASAAPSPSAPPDPFARKPGEKPPIY